MEPLAILKADPLDLLFDNRNKSYGAYPLRKYYERRLYLSLGIALSAGVLLFCALTLGPKPETVRNVDIGDVTLLPPALAKPEIKIKPPVHPPQVIRTATVNDTRPVIVPDREVIKPVATQAELATAHLGGADIAGPPDNGIVPAGPVAGAGPGTEAVVPAKPVEPAVFSNPEVMPQFPGGRDALQRFLMRNLRMPEGAEAGTRISVQATFVIGVDGKLQQVDMTRSGGAAFDAEVKRVLARMPSWIPGRMGNRPVAVYFSLPVQFLVPEE